MADDNAGGPGHATAVATGTTILLTILFLVAAVAANRWKRDLRVGSIRAEGNRIVTEQEILDLAAVRKGDRLFGVDLLGLRKRVEANPFLRSVEVSRDLPDEILISVTERTPIAVAVGDRQVYLDAEGFVLPPARSAEMFDLPVLTGTLPRSECVPGKAVNDENVREALSLLATARAIDDDLYRLISEIHLDGDRDIVLYTAESGVPVIVGHARGAKKLVELDGFWTGVVARRGAQDLQSIDLRYDDQVVVRWTHGPEQAAPAGAAVEPPAPRD